MKKTHKNSRIEVWNVYYINNDDNRRSITDRDVVIVQVEHAHDDQYIVEIVDREDFEDED